MKLHLSSLNKVCNWLYKVGSSESSRVLLIDIIFKKCPKKAEWSKIIKERKQLLLVGDLQKLDICAYMRQFSSLLRYVRNEQACVNLLMMVPAVWMWCFRAVITDLAGTASAGIQPLLFHFSYTSRQLLTIAVCACMRACMCVCVCVFSRGDIARPFYQWTLSVPAILWQLPDWLQLSSFTA